MRHQPLILAALVFSLLAPAALADEVIKKDGTSVIGFIVSQDSRFVKIKDAQGRVHRILMKDVASVIEGWQTGNEEVDARLQQTDTSDPVELFKVAQWAKDGKNKAWELVAMQTLRADPGHAGAHDMLGHIQVDGTWYETKSEAEKARKEGVEKRLKEEGYLRWRGGWISKEDRQLAYKDPDAFAKDDDGIWRDKAMLMKEKGYVLVNGSWVKAGTEQDKNDMQRFKELLADDIWVITTTHFRLYVQENPPEKVDQFGELVEKVYAWFLEQMALAGDAPVFRGNRGSMWVLKDKRTAVEWYKNYRNPLGLDDQFGVLLERGSGNIFSPGKLLAIHVPSGDGDRLENQLVNHAAQMCLFWHSRGIQPEGSTDKGHPDPWLYEGFGVHAEQVHLGNGVVVHSTLAKYGGDGGIANKAFTTKDAADRCKGMVRSGDDMPFVSLTRIELNQLSGDHIAKAYTIVRWLMEEHLEKFREWLTNRNTMTTPQALQKAFGWSTEDLDERWRDLVNKKF